MNTRVGHPFLDLLITLNFITLNSGGVQEECIAIVFKAVDSSQE